jgi:hypothetical protein
LFALALGWACLGCGPDENDDPKPNETFNDDTPAPFDPSTPYEPMVEPSDLSANITNPFLPMPVGATWVSEMVTEDGTERIEVSVESATREVWGVDVRVVHDSAYLDGELIEDTEDWFAEDGAGNVWYMGEETIAYDPTEPPSTAGSWEAGVNGALPGIVMLADPSVSSRYRQEYYVGEAEDYAIVRAHDQEVSVPAGDYTGCIKIEERSVLEPDMQEFKYYCAGVGNVLVEEEEDREELVETGGL